MRRIVLCLGILLAWPLAGQAAKPAEPASIEFGAGAWVDVDATGKAHVVEMDKLSRFKDDGEPGSIADIIKARLRERIETWEFQPPTKNGVAVPGRTHLAVSLKALGDDAGGMSIRVLDAGTGPKLADVRMQELVKLFMIDGQEGKTTVNVEWRSDGSIDTVEILGPSNLSSRNTTASLQPGGRKAMLAVVKTWHIDPEIVDGAPIPGSGMIPIVFCWGDTPCKNDGDAEKPQRSELVASNPAISLRTAVAETVL